MINSANAQPPLDTPQREKKETPQSTPEVEATEAVIPTVGAKAKKA